MTSAKTKYFANGHSSKNDPVDFEAIRRQLEKEAAQLEAETALRLKDPFISDDVRDNDNGVLESSFLETKKTITKSTSTTYLNQEEKTVPMFLEGHSVTSRKPGILKSSRNGHGQNGYFHDKNGSTARSGKSNTRRNSIRYSFDLKPGLRPEDLTVQIVDDTLRVCVIPHQKSSPCKDRDCYREVALPATVDPTSATAVLSKEGFLTVDLFTS